PIYFGHVAAVPQRLEDPVGEPEHQQILDRLLAEVMVDPVDLIFLEDAGEVAVERTGAFVVVAEGLLDDDAGPAPLRARQARGAQVLDDPLVEARRRGEIEEAVRGSGT